MSTKPRRSLEPDYPAGSRLAGLAGEPVSQERASGSSHARPYVRDGEPVVVNDFRPVSRYT